ncbi:MAG: hypothetical protein FJ096_03085 [Deltaproteobacteria bacterium]|nr:hypothetical protein [Deltaproteobacteria bacterium]
MTTLSRLASRTRTLFIAAAAAASGLAACAQAVVAVTDDPSGSSGGGGEGGSRDAASSSVASSSSGSPMVEPQACMDGTFALGFDDAGKIRCGAIDEGVVAALHSSCSLYFGWRDSCDNCMEGPAKWGRVSGESCENGAGADASCLGLTVGDEPLPLYGVSPDGNVDGNDKFYVGLHCPTLGESATPGPCEPGEVAVSWSETGYHTCYPIARLVGRYVAESCSAYLGWRDSCGGCNEPPSKWGRTGMDSCANGAGDDGTCATPLLGGRWVTTLGVNTDGNVNDDDKFYAGLHCKPRDDGKVDALDACPPGTALVGIDADASLVCASLAPAVAAIVRKRCFVYLGWRDSCDGCNEPPTKWGRASTEACELFGGSESACLTATLDGVQVPMVALNTDGDVNGDDKFYAGFRCIAKP